MIRRTGTDPHGNIRCHVIYNPLEIMKRVRKRSTVRLLDELQFLYDLRARRLMAAQDPTAHVDSLVALEAEGYLMMMDSLRKWLQPPLTVNFSENLNEQKSKSRRRSNRKRR